MNQALVLLDKALPVGSVDTYLQAVNRVPMLSHEEEIELAERLQRDNDMEAARRLVLSHMRFVVRIAKNYQGYGLALTDLIQEGSIGLMKAVKRFDPTMNVRLVSFAVHWIRAEIHEFILRNWRIVKVATTKAQRKLFFNLRSAKKRLGWLNQAEVQAVAQDLGVPEKTVMEMESRLSGQDISFDPSDADDENHTAPAAFLQDMRADPAEQIEHNDWQAHKQSRLDEALDELDARSREIITQRWLAEDKKSTLQELAQQFQVSAERVRQLEANAIKKLKSAMQA